MIRRDPKTGNLEGIGLSDEEAAALDKRHGRLANRTWRGLGDVLASVTKAVGVAPCKSCKKRQDTLNRRFPL